MSSIRLSISPHFHNKENRAPGRANKETGEISSAWAYSAFATVSWSPVQIADHLCSGRAICVAALKNGERRVRTNFASAQIVGLDFDDNMSVDTLLMDDFIEEHAFLIYPTASSTPEAPRSRVLFILDAPVLDAKEYQRYVLKLLAKYSTSDKLKDEVRIFYGSTIEGASRVPSARLPIAVLEALPDPAVEKPVIERREERAVTVSTGEAREAARRYVDRAIERTIGELVSTRTEQNNALNLAALKLGHLVGASWAGLDRGKAEALLQDAAIANGYQQRDGVSAVKATIRSGLDAGMRKPQDEPQWRGRDDDASEENTKSQTAHGNVIRAEFGAWSIDGSSALAPSVQPQPLPQIVPPSEFDPDRYIVSGRQALMRYLDRITEEHAPKVKPLIIPYKVLHRFGGYAHVIMPGKMIGIAGSTGGGKTSFIDTLIDAWRREGENVIAWSPEWTADESADRFGMRHGGATMEEMYLHEIAKWERDNNVPPARRVGKLITQAQREDSATAVATAALWKGDVYYVESPEGEELNFSLLMAIIRAKVEKARKDGTDIRVLVIDYAQMLVALSRDKAIKDVNDALQIVKRICVELKLVGVVASQVTKADSRSAAGGDKKPLDESSANYLRFDAFNLAFTLNIDRDEDGKPTGLGIINVVKNSIGKRGQQSVNVNLARLTWTDVPGTHVDLRTMTAVTGDEERDLHEQPF